MRKSVPLLTSNFASLVNQGGYFVDKTNYIPLLEGLSFPNIFFLRPRRFGKSLLISMLEYYYGLQYKTEFKNLFGQYYIGQEGNSTSLKNSFRVLHFDFSGISTSEPEVIKRSFCDKLTKGFREFYAAYGGFDIEILEKYAAVSEPGDYLLKVLSEISLNIPNPAVYLFIDEYDHFTNELFSFDRSLFRNIVAGNGWVRKFYEVVKQFTANQVILRFFAAGVTPVTLDSMTSGFNIGHNLTMNSQFHGMAGFTHPEVVRMIQSVSSKSDQAESEKLAEEIRDWYNGSKFSPDASEKIYNPQLVITFLSSYIQQNAYPREMADVNVVSDYKKISGIIEILPENEQEDIINEVLTAGKISESLTNQYNFERKFTKTDAVSLLYYNGLLTIENAYFELIIYTVPNYVIRQLYWEYFRIRTEEKSGFRFDKSVTGDIIRRLAFEDNPDMLIEYTHQLMSKLSNRDFRNFTEQNIKMIMLTILMGTNAFLVQSEPETSAGYADILIRRSALNPGKHDFLFELKYIKKQDEHKTDAVINEGLRQLKGYTASMMNDNSLNISPWLIVFTGKDSYKIIKSE